MTKLVARRYPLAIVLALASHAALAATCDVSWRIRPQIDAIPRHLDVEVAWTAGERTSTPLRIEREWGGVDDFAKRARDWRAPLSGQSIVDASEEGVKLVRHRPHERVVVRYRVVTSVPDPDSGTVERRDVYSALVGNGWFHITGYAVFAVPQPYEEAGRPLFCVTIDAPRRKGIVITSYGVSRTGTATIRTRGGADGLRHALYLGGAFDVREVRIRDKPLYIARRGAWRFDVDAFAAAVERLVATHRTFWNDFAFEHFVIELLPTNLPQGESGGTGLVNAFSMYGSRDFNVPGDAFDFLVGHEHLHTWIPKRFGAMGKDEALHYWFSEGFTDFYTHRLLVKSGLWPLEAYAEALDRKISHYLASPALMDNRRVAAEFFFRHDVGQLAYQRGEFVALRWHGELWRRGYGGLDPVMRGLMLPRAPDEDAKTPLATTRLLERLDALIGDSARRDVERLIERGEAFAFDEHTLGPCFALEWSTQPARWRLGFDRDSLAAGVVGGVEVDGPAYRAGLRNGQRILGYNVYGGDVARNSSVTIRDDDGTPRRIAYRPADGEMRVPLYRVAERARDDAQCRRWFGLADGDTFAPAPPVPSPASSATLPKS